MNKKTNLVIFLLIIIILFVGGGFLIYKYNKNFTEDYKENSRLILRENFQKKLDNLSENNKKNIINDIILPKEYYLLKDDCSKIIDEKLKKDCYYYLKYNDIVKTENIPLCDTLNDEWQDICLFDMIENRRRNLENEQNWEDCLMIKDRGLKNVCLEHQAIVLKDKDACLERDIGVVECVDRTVAINVSWGDDITKCKNVKTPEYFERCIGISGQDCSLLEDKNLIDQCESWRYFNIILFHGEKTECEILPIENFKIICESYFDNDKNFIDSDDDGILDHVELSLGTQPFNGSDGAAALSHIEDEKIADHIIDQKKFTVFEKLQPLTIDTDADGLRDYDEINIYKTDLNNQDTDGDGYTDGDEVKSGYNPNGDGLLIL